MFSFLQDGSVEKEIPSRDLYSVYHLDDNEFFPGDYVAKAEGKYINNCNKTIQIDLYYWDAMDLIWTTSISYVNIDLIWSITVFLGC